VPKSRLALYSTRRRWTERNGHSNCEKWDGAEPLATGEYTTRRLTGEGCPPSGPSSARLRVSVMAGGRHGRELHASRETTSFQTGDRLGAPPSTTG